MKLRLLAGLFSVVLIGGFLAFNQSMNSNDSARTTEPCEEPLTYQFGNIDSRYDISRKQLREVMNKVEALWATALDKKVLSYNDNGKVTIELVYSEDQERTDREQELSKQIREKKIETTVAEDKYNRLSSKFKTQRSKFQQLVSEYNSLIETYNELRKQWQDKEIPEDVKKKMEQLKYKISQKEITVNNFQRDLEELRKKTNKQSRELNQLIDEQNKLINKYNSQFSKPEQFDQGRYLKNGPEEVVRIFQFSNLSELKTVLAHEMGHALGLQHVENSQSVMHYMMGSQNIFNLSLTEQDIAALKERCAN